MLRGLHTEDDRHQLNAASRLVRRHPGTLFVVDTLILPPGAQQDALGRRVQAGTRHWPRPTLAYLAGTWLGATTLQPNTWINRGAEHAMSAASARYDAQADAVLYLGPGEVLTASRPDPAIYHWGAYPQQLRRLSPIVGGAPDDLVDTGLRLAQAGPSWFAQ